VPQAPHPHFAFTAARSLEKRFPGLAPLLGARGAPSVDIGRDLVFETPEGIGARAPSGRRTYMCSRALLDELMLRVVRDDPRVELLADVRVDGLEFAADRRRVVAPRAGGGGVDARVRDADLYVDAGGRGGHTARWLRAAGLEPPVERTFGHPAVYHTVHLARTGPAPVDYRAAAVLVRDHGRLQGALLLPVEEDGLVVTAMDFAPQAQIGGVADLLDFLARMPGRVVHDAIRGAVPRTDRVYRYACPGSRALGTETLAQLDNYVVLGDALCFTTPLLAIGLGMACEAGEILGEVLDEDPGTVPARFYRRAGGMVARALGQSHTFNRRFFADRERSHARLTERAHDFLVTQFMRAATVEPRLHLAFLRARFPDPADTSRGGARWPFVRIVLDPLSVACVLRGLLRRWRRAREFARRSH